jgi:hypothetical protein
VSEDRGNMANKRRAEKRASRRRKLDIWGMLETSRTFSVDDINAAFRQEAVAAHPDVGGSNDQFVRLVAARDELFRRTKRLPRWQAAA